MLRRIALIAVIAIVFGGAMYTTIGCGGYTSPTDPTIPTTLSGTVSDAVTGNLVVNRADVVRVSQRGIVSIGSIRVDGSYFFGGLEPGEATMTLSTTGYEPFSTRFTLVNGDNHLDIRLQPAK